jgi:hypothetical protein
MTASPDTALYHRPIDFRGWDALELGNGLIRLVAVPAIGGRVMALDLGIYPYLFVDPDLAGKLFSPEENQGDGSLAAWKNYGGDKTWPSPQGWDTDDQWHGPPDPVLDTGRYTATLGSDDDHIWIALTSPEDPRSGMQITRRFTLRPGSSRVEVDLSFRNVSQRTRRWSIWDVIQLEASRKLPDGSLALEPTCTVTAEVNPHSHLPDGFTVMFGALDNPQWQADPTTHRFTASYLWEIGKVGLDASAGWIAFSNSAQGYAFAERYPYYAGQDYPDQGVCAECWTIGRGKVANLDYEQSSIYLMETEVLSPFYIFAPGETRHFELTWGVTRLHSPVHLATEGGCLAATLTARRQGPELLLSGQLGVFDVGQLCAQVLDQAGAVLRETDLMAVNPATPVTLSEILACPAEAVSVRLMNRPSTLTEPRTVATLTFTA